MKRSPLYSWSVSACGPVIIHLLLVRPLQVSKVVRAGEVSEEERRQIFSAIGFSFVNRLLNTSEIHGTKTEAWALLIMFIYTAEEATLDGSVVVSAYQRLAVTLLACFTTDPQLV